MDIAKRLRALRLSAWAVTGFSLLLIAAGIAQMGLGGMALKDYYAEVEARQALDQRSRYAWDQQYLFELEYSRSSSAFLNAGRIQQEPPALPAASSPVGVASIVLLGALVGFILSALAWVWLAHGNLTARGIRARYTAGKVVAAYCVPLLNLVVPFDAMKELHNRSHGEDEESALKPVDDVTAWWVAVICGLLIFSAMLAKFALDALSNLYIMTPLFMEYALFCFAMLLLLASAFLFSNLARAISRAQADYLPTVDLHHEPIPAQPRMAVNLRGA